MTLKTLIIVPAYNEALNIEKTVQDIKLNSPKMNYVIINDGSKDNTLEVIKNNDYNYIDGFCNQGLFGAVQTGFKLALKEGYDVAIQFDGDGQHDISYVETILKPLQKGQADLCIGSRFLDDTSEFKSTGARRVGIKIISFLIRLFAHIKIMDPTSGFRAANRSVIQHFAMSYPREYPEPESIVNITKLNYRVIEQPVKMRERTGGVSSIRAWKTVYYMINVGLSIIVTSLKKKGDC